MSARAKKLRADAPENVTPISSAALSLSLQERLDQIRDLSSELTRLSRAARAIDADGMGIEDLDAQRARECLTDRCTLLGDAIFALSDNEWGCNAQLLEGVERVACGISALVDVQDRSTGEL